jgi:transposase
MRQYRKIIGIEQGARMSLHPQDDHEVPEETARIARAAFPKGSLAMEMHDELGVLFTDADFANLFPAVGQPGETPWRLALVLILQFMENLTDRQAADAVRGRIDWKYALGLELSDAGFDYSILSEFRTRLLEGKAETLLLDRLLERFIARGWLKAGGRQRTDSTHVLAAIHGLNRLELVGRTLQAVLEELARQVPEWLKLQITPEWFDRYSRLIDEYRLPKKETERQPLAERIGQDGQYLLERLEKAAPRAELGELPIVKTMQTVWQQQYEAVDGRLHWRDRDALPPSGERIASPFDPAARYCIKREEKWVGYKVHLTETCTEQSPNLITHVETVPATEADIQALDPIHHDLQQRQLLPAEHVVDTGYGSGETIHASQVGYGVDLYGPVHVDTAWQARTENAFDANDFRVDWEQKQVHCPQGHLSREWTTTKTSHGNPAIFVRFSSTDCRPCPVRGQCTHSKSGVRELTLLPREAFLTLQMARQRQKTEEFVQKYAVRAGIEGTISQAVSILDLRRSRYIGLEKTHLQHLLTAAALNIIRIVAWIQECPRAQTRQSHFAALAGV